MKYWKAPTFIILSARQVQSGNQDDYRKGEYYVFSPRPMPICEYDSNTVDCWPEDYTLNWSTGRNNSNILCGSSVAIYFDVCS